MHSPTYDAAALLTLQERTDFELALIEDVYALTGNHLRSQGLDSAVYQRDGSLTQVSVALMGNVYLADWREQFLRGGAALVFISTFKILDMYHEWIIGLHGEKVSYKFAEKLKMLRDLPFLDHPFVESRPWLKSRLRGLYKELEPYRGIVIHDRTFVSGPTELVIDATRKARSIMTITSVALRTLASLMSTIIRGMQGTLTVTPLLDLWLQSDLDGIATMHGVGVLGQLTPYVITVWAFGASNQTAIVNIDDIKSTLASRNPNRSNLFNLAVVFVAADLTSRTFIIDDAHTRTGILVCEEQHMAAPETPTPRGVNVARAARALGLLPPPSHAEIAAEANAVWIRRGGGNDMERSIADWQEAERRLMNIPRVV